MLTGAGVPAVNVLVTLDGAGFSRSTRTDTGGRYKIFDSRVGTFTLKAFEPKTNIPTVMDVTIAEGQVTEKNLTLIGFGTIQVQANFADGKPAGGAPVQISQSRRGGSFVPAGTTNGAGKLTITDVVEGDFVVRVFHPSNSSVHDDKSGTIAHDGDSVSVTATLQVDNPPTVTLTKPTDGATFVEGSSVQMEATATDDLGIDHVEFLINDVSKASDSSAPYSSSVSLAGLAVGSTPQLKARALDTGGNKVDSAPVTIHITTDQPPTITLTEAPADGSNVEEGSVVVFAGTTSDDIGIAGIDLVVDGTVRDTKPTSLFSFSFTVPSAASVTNPMTFVVTSRDTKGQSASTPTIHLNVVPTQGTCVLQPAGLVSWWKGEGAANDSAGSNGGMLQNGMGFTPGKVGQAFSFDGVNDAVQIRQDTFNGLTDLTVEAWVRFNVLHSPSLSSQTIISALRSGTAGA